MFSHCITWEVLFSKMEISNLQQLPNDSIGLVGCLISYYVDVVKGRKEEEG